MGFFARLSQRVEPPVLTATPHDLTRIGRTAFGGQDPHPPGISAISIAELEPYFPCRPRSRDQMRIEARGMAASGAGAV
jgi:hypothetical protein